MTFDDPVLMALAGVLAGLWLLFAGWASVRGIIRQREAASATRRAAQMAAMIEASPALPLVVRPDGRIEGAGAIAALFGLDRLPSTLDGLGAAEPARMAGRDFAGLKEAVVLAQKTARPFQLVLRSVDRTTAIAVSGVPAPSEIGIAGAALLWFSDASATERDHNRLRSQLTDSIRAFESMSALIEAAPFPMWFRDPSLGLALVNTAYVTATEAAGAGDVIARQIELIEPLAGVSALDAAAQARENGAALSRLVPVTIGGQRRMMQAVDVPIEDAGVAGYAIDRQELEDARSEHRRFREARRSMLDQMSAAVAEFAPDRSLRFVNQPFVRLFQFDSEWVASAPPIERVLDKMRDNGRTPEVRDFPGWRAERRGWFALTDLVEESWLLRDGTHLRTVAQPTPDGGLLLIFEDRTEQIRLASARDTLLRVRTATFDNLFEAVAVFSPDGKLNLWNQRFRRLWDVSEEYLTAHPRIDQLLEKIAPSLEDPRQHNVVRQLVVGATGDRQQRTGRIGFADGRQFDFAAIPLPDGNALFTLIDVTDSRRIERALRDRARALEDADRLKTDFLSRISYDLRTPLTSIGGFAEMLDSGLAGDLGEQAKSYVHAILESTGALSRQIDSILDLSQSEAGAMPMERKALSLNAIVTDAVDAVRREAAASGVTITADVRHTLGQASGDARRLRQVIDQLLAQAVAGFGGEAGGEKRVLVFADGDASTAQIVISDNGKGVEPTGANAVGLALARQLVAAHDGRFEAVHRPGEGSMFAMFLPR